MSFRTLAVPFLAAMVAAGAISMAQESAQLIAAPEVIGSDVDCFRMAPDLNGDGDKDAVSIWFAGPASARIAGWRNDGAGVFTPGWAITVPLTFNPPLNIFSKVEVHTAVGDLNGDGAEDFAFSLDNFVGWWLSNGDLAAPTAAWAVVLPLPVRDLAVADFDQDGRADVAALTWSEVRIYRSQAAASPVLASTLALPLNDGMRLAVAEFSGDATPDLAILRVAELDIHPVLLGVIQPGTNWASPLTDTSGIAAGDVDGDGDADLVVSAAVLGNQLTGPQLHIRVFRRTGPATFVPEATQVKPSSFGTGSMLADVDHDGDRDLIAPLGTTGFSIGQPLTNGGGGGAVVWRNLGAGAFGSDQIWRLAGASGALAIADLDGDGDADVIAGRSVGYGIPGRGVLPDPLVGNPGALGPPPDWDRDGDPDLTPGISAVAQGTTAINDGSGAFTVTAVVAPPAAPGTSYFGPGFPGDFDGDGDVDLLVEHANGTSTFAGFEMRLLKNVGGGGGVVDGGPASPMGTTMRIVPTDGPTGSVWQFKLDDRTVLVTDVDADLDLDVIVLYPPVDGSYGPETGSKIWLNGGSGFFTPGADLPGLRPIAAGDVTGDGIRDLVAMQRTGTTSALVVCQGLGGATFALPSALASGLSNVSTIDQPALVDLDQDGDLDLVAGLPGYLTEFTNDGSGNLFASTIGSLDPVNSIDVVRAGDLNGDGWPDVVVSVATGVRVFLRAPGGGGWLAPRNWSANLGSLVDLDGDGDLELLAQGSFYRNMTFAPPTNGLRKQYGMGLAGSGGFVPVIGSFGVLRAGHSGEIRITNALGGAAGFFGAGVSEAALPVLGGTLLISPDIVLPVTLSGAAGVPGAGYLAIPWTLPPGLAGAQFFEQAAIADPAAPQGFSLTQGVRCVIGT